MSFFGNVTMPENGEPEKTLLRYYEMHDLLYGFAASPAMMIVHCCITGVFICFGGFFNILTIIILIRRRLWNQHEGYICLLAILSSNIARIAMTEFPIWIAHLAVMPAPFRKTRRFANSSDLACKVWSFFIQFHHFTTLFVVALLLNVYLRRHVTSSRRYVKAFAGKYCTNCGSLVVICIIATVSFVVNIGRTKYYSLHQMSDLDNLRRMLFDPTIKNTSEVNLCFPSERDVLFRFRWDLTEMTLASYLPVAIFLPLLLFMIRCTGTRFGQPNTKDFTLTATYIAISLFISMVPMSVTDFRFHFSILSKGVLQIHKNLTLNSFLDIIVFMLSLSYFVVVPVVCLTNLQRMRDILKSYFRGKCPCTTNENADVEMDANATSSLDVTETPLVLNT